MTGWMRKVIHPRRLHHFAESAEPVVPTRVTWVQNNGCSI